MMKTLSKLYNSYIRHCLLLFSVMTTFASQIFAAGTIHSYNITHQNTGGNDRIAVNVVRKGDAEECYFGNPFSYYPRLEIHYRFSNTDTWKLLWTAAGGNGTEMNNTYYLDNPVRGIPYYFKIKGYEVSTCGGSVVTGGTDSYTLNPAVPYPATWSFSGFEVATNSNRTTNTLTWNAPSDQTNMNEAAGGGWSYKIDRRSRKWGETNWGSWTTDFATVAKTATSYTDNSTIQSCYEYQYRLRITMTVDSYIFESMVSDEKELTLPSLTEVSPQDFIVVNEAGLQCQSTAGNRELQWNVPVSKINSCAELWFQIRRQRVNEDGQNIGTDSLIVDSAAGRTYGGSKFAANTNWVEAIGDNNGLRKFSFTDNLNLQLGQRYKYSLIAYTRINANGEVGGTLASAILTAQANILGLISGGGNQILTKQIIEKTVKITWADNWQNESKFYVYRKPKNSSDPFQILKNVQGDEVILNANTTTYTDNTAALCIPYSYEVRAYNECYTSTTPFLVGSVGVSDTIQLSGNINDTYSETSLKGFKGYASDFVQLDWTVENNSGSISTQHLYRRLLGDSTAPMPLADIGSGTRQFKDASADANTLYEYFIEAKGNCGITPMVSTRISDVGYRSPAGMVIGHVEYEGGISVQDCKVGAEKNSGINNNKSIYFDGDRDYFVFLDGDNSAAATTLAKNNTNYAHQADLDFLFDTAKGRTIEFWFNASELKQEFVFTLGKTLDANGNALYITTPSTGNSQWRMVIEQLGNANPVVYTFALGVQPGEWHHFAYTDKAGLVKIYLDGSNKDLYGNPMQWQINTNWTKTANNPLKHALFVGSDKWGSDLTNTFKGYMDEFRCWGVARTEEQIRSTMNGYLQGNETDLGIYLRMDEGVGNILYDASYKPGGIYNGNHAIIPRKLHAFNQLGFSTVVPPVSMLGSNAVTDENGNYIIPFIRYDNTGDLFKITPFITNHQFQPNNRTLFIGNSTPVQNNVDFKDISSFPVTGTIFYGNNENDISCPAAGIYLAVDGNIVVRDGAPVQTDANGEFNIRVPIGEHYISAQQSLHTFAAGRFPATGTFDFQQPVSGLTFIDNTKVSVIGKVVGGTTQAAYKSGLGRSKNNIGTATLVFESTKGCYTDTAITDEHGDYAIELYPIEYTLHGANSLNPQLFIPSNPIIEFPVQNVNLTQIPPVQTYRDTVYDNNGNVIGVDSVQAHLVKDFVYRTGHSLFVLDTAGNPFNKGEEYIFVNHSDGQDTLFTNQLAYPVFQKGGVYAVKVKLTEIYANMDDAANIIYDTTGASDGTITVNNQLTGGEPYSFALQNESGDSLLVFQVGDPNVTQNPTFPEKDFTKTLQIVSVIGQTQNTWTLDGYVLGSKADGTKFATQSPQIVDHVLRDPPGSGSSARIAKNSEFRSSQNWSLVGKAGLNLATKIGVDFSSFVGMGVMLKNEVKGQVTYDFSTNLSVGGGEAFSETVTVSEDIATSADPAFVGADADLFIGKSVNMDFGIADHVEFIDTTLCGGGTPCKATDMLVSAKGKQYSIARRKGFQIDPKGYGTYFIYTQRHIRTQLIPDLIALRNNLLETSSDYQIVFSNKNDAERYGSNNDDPIWADSASTPTPLNRESADSAGPSYVFLKVFDPDDIVKDSVRWYNEQIRLWKNALAKNEEAKLNAVNGQSVANAGSLGLLVDSNVWDRSAVLWTQEVSALQQNVSFSSGQSYSRNVTLSNNQEGFISWELDMSMALGHYIEASAAGLGTTAQTSLTIGVAQSGQSGTGRTVSTAYGFTLEDGNSGDFYSVDILDGGAQNGPIFKTRGGATSCPYEGALETQFHKPIGTIIQPATVQREKPDISIFPAKQVGIPSDQEAVFTITLSNSNTDEDMTYALSVDDVSNPHGAILTIDGLNPNRTFTVPAGSSINKILVVRKSPHVTDFNNIKLSFGSGCGDNISADASFSVSFIPTCSRTTLQSPTNNWVLNSSFNNTLPVIMKDYDLNFAGFQKAIFRYKPSSSATWINTKEFYNLEAAGSDSLILSRDNIYTAFDWDVTNLPDGNYDIQIQTVCANNITRNSEVYSGKIDRRIPVNFGQPTPLNGVLTANDELGIRFNETINEGLINKNLDIDVRGVLNSTAIAHFTSLQFSGTQTMTIPAVSLDAKSFTIEFHAKKTDSSAQVIASQTGLWNIGFNESNQIYFEIGSERVTANIAADITNWHHYAVVFDNALHKASIYVDAEEKVNGNITATIDQGGADLIIGESFTGTIHELRLWNDVRTLSEIQSNYLVSQKANAAGLLGYWPLDEGRGNIANDLTGKRQANVPNTWTFAQQARAIHLDGTDGYFEIDAAALNADEETDFTISFWFKTNNLASHTLFSNGNADTGTIGYQPKAWHIYSTTGGYLFVKNNGYVLPVNNPVLSNNEWQHFALVVNRQGSTDVFINGNLLASTNSNRFTALAGSKAYIGAYGRITGATDTVTNFFTGSFDEITFWNAAREQKQIIRDAYYRLKGDEPGLLAYYPFEKYANAGSGQLALTQTADDQADKSAIGLYPFPALLRGEAAFTNETAPVKIERPVEAVTFTYVVNNDAIIITPTTAAGRIEKTILDITVRNIQDMNGNKMSSAVTWTAFVSKNQVVWNNETHEATIAKGAAYSFTATIENKGGKQESYSITNLPAWLTASRTSGTINPLTTQQIVFTVKEGLNIGRYEQNIALSNQFGSGEILALTLNVTGKTPEWTINPANFEYSMGIVGQLKIQDVFSTDENDMLAAFVGDEIRGVAKVNKNSNYRAYLNIYSNTASGENLTFRIYDASTGLILDDITPANLIFVNNALQGTLANPTVFSGGEVQLTSIDLKTGWNWVSFNVQPAHPDVDSVLAKMNVSAGDIIKGRSSFDEYSTATGWVGSLSMGGGINFKESYRLNVANAGTVQVKGATVNLKNTPVIIQTGWNWIAYLGSNILQVNEALASFNANAGDVVKGQKSFAIYDPATGWTGSLSTLEPGRGYMLSATDTGRVIYPKASSFASYGKTGTVQTLDLPVAYETNMSVIAELVTDNYSLVHDYYLIAKDGKGNMLGGVSSQGLLYYLTVQGNAETGKAYFFLKHKTTGTELALKETLTFTPNLLTGYPQSFKLHLDANTTTGIAEQAAQSLQHIAVYPNPVGDESKLSIRYTSREAAHASVDIYSVLGVKVGEVFTGELVKGENKFTFNTDKLAKGIYMIVINKNGVSETVKFTK